MKNDKEELFLEKRFLELANNAYQKGIHVYSDFLNLNEQNIFNNTLNKMPPINTSLIGGYVCSERKIAIFSSKEAFYELEEPIDVIKVSPINKKFSDNLTHRDFLGAIMNLGIDRCKIGDIQIKDNEAYVYVIDSMSQYIVDNLTRIKHTSVISTACRGKEFVYEPQFKEILGTVNNIRLDAVISLAFGSSRSSIVSFIEKEKVFVNGKLITSNGHPLKEGDIISVRGLGRCIFSEHLNITKKGRNMIKILLYK